MKITKINNITKVNIKNKEEFCDKIIEKVMRLCENYPLFKHDKLKKLDSYINEINEKNYKLDNLLKKSEIFKDNLTNKIHLLKEENEKNKNQLLKLIRT